MATTNFEWVLPTVGGSAGVWGNILNDAFEDIDGDLQTVKGTADAALPRAGGAMTGEIEVHSAKHKVVDLAAGFALDLATGRFFHKTVTGTGTFSFSNVPASPEAVFVMLEITNGGSAAVSWPAAVKWPHGQDPSLTTSGVDVIALYTRDGGTTWRATRAQEDSK